MFQPGRLGAWTRGWRIRRICSNLCLPGAVHQLLIRRQIRVDFMPKVTFVTEKKEIEVPLGSNLRQEAMKAGVQVYKGIHRALNCHGFGLCGSCKVLVKKGGENLSPKGLLEKFTLATSPTTTFG